MVTLTGTAVGVNTNERSRLLRYSSDAWIRLTWSDHANFDRRGRQATGAPAKERIGGTASFGNCQGKGDPMISFADVNGNHRVDLLLNFRTDDLQLTKADTQAV